MQVNPARGLQVAIATLAAPTVFLPLRHVFLRRFTVRMEDEAVTAYVAHPWQVQSAITKQAATIEAEIALGEDSALTALRDAAFLATGLILQVTFPDATTASGLYGLSHYEVFAEEGDVLRIAFTAHSRDALLFDFGSH